MEPNLSTRAWLLAIWVDANVVHILDNFQGEESKVLDESKVMSDAFRRPERLLGSVHDGELITLRPVL